MILFDHFGLPRSNAMILNALSGYDDKRIYGSHTVIGFHLIIYVHFYQYNSVIRNENSSQDSQISLLSFSENLLWPITCICTYELPFVYPLVFLITCACIFSCEQEKKWVYNLCVQCDHLSGSFLRKFQKGYLKI